MKKTKISFTLLLIICITFCSIIAYASEQPDFHNLFEPYMHSHDYNYVIDLDNDAVPELLAFDQEYYVTGYGAYYIIATVYKIYDDIGVTKVHGDDYQFTNGGIDGISCSAYYSDTYGRIYFGRTDSFFTYELNLAGAWKYLSFLEYHNPSPGEIEIISAQSNQFVFEKNYNYHNTFSEYRSEELSYIDLNCYTYPYGLNMLIPVYGWSQTKTPYTSLPDIDPWSTWVSPAISINGNLLRFNDCKPYYYGEHTMVPMRKFFESIGATVDWDNYTQKVTAQLDGNKVEMYIGNNTIYANGNERYLDVAPTITNGRTYIPLRAISESLDANVYWDNYNKIARISVY